MESMEEIFDTLPEHYEERSSILIYPIEKVNIGIESKSKIINLVVSLTPEESK